MTTHDRLSPGTSHALPKTRRAHQHRMHVTAKLVQERAARHFALAQNPNLPPQDALQKGGDLIDQAGTRAKHERAASVRLTTSAQRLTAASSHIDTLFLGEGKIRRDVDERVFLVVEWLPK